MADPHHEDPIMTVPIALCEAETTSGVKTPIAISDHRIDGGMPIEIEVARAASEDATSGVNDDDGQVTVYGADLPSPFLQENAQRAKGSDFDANDKLVLNLDYAAFSNYNWLVFLNGTLLERNASPSTASHFNIADSSGSAELELGADPDAEAIVEVYFVTPATVLPQTDAGVLHKVAAATAKEVMWASLAGTTGQIGATNVYIRATVP